MAGVRRVGSRSVIRGTFILAASGATCRVIGFIVRILLVRIVGPEGIGLFTRVSAIYSLILSLASAGTPVALARLSAIGLARGDLGYLTRLFRVALIITVFTGTVAAVSFLGAAPFISSRLLGDPRSYHITVCLSPALLIVATSSVIRGFLQGYQWMEPIATGQLVERIVSGIVTLALAGSLITRGLGYSAAGIAMGTVAGEMAGFIVLLMALPWAACGGGLWPKNPMPGPTGGDPGLVRRPGRSRWPLPRATCDDIGTAVEIVSIALPVSLLRLAASAVSAISAIIIPAGLVRGSLTLHDATSIYGNFTGIAMSLVSFPTILTFALSSNLVPALSRALEAGDTGTAQRHIERAISITLLVGLMATGTLVALGEPICRWVFRTPRAGPVTVALSWGSVFIYLRTTSGGMMNGMGMVPKSLLNFVVANAFGIALTCFLVSQPSIGIYGAVAGLLVSSAMDAMLNLCDVRRRLGISWEFSRLLRWPLLAGFTSGAGARAAYIAVTRAGLSPFLGLLIGLLPPVLGLGAGFILSGVSLSRSKK